MFGFEFHKHHQPVQSFVAKNRITKRSREKCKCALSSTVRSESSCEFNEFYLVSTKERFQIFPVVYFHAQRSIPRDTFRIRNRLVRGYITGILFMYYFAVCVRSSPKYPTTGAHSHSYEYRFVFSFNGSEKIKSQ